MNKLVVGLVSILISLTAMVSCGYLAENKYFDQLIFEKSPYHGYGYWGQIEDMGQIKYWITSLILASRIKDVTSLKTPFDSQRILGVDDEETDRFTVALIGDSMAFGTGVRTEQRFGNVLQKKLQRLRPTRVYVLAVPGDSVIENYTKYVLAREILQPDLVIFTILNNDLVLNEPSRYPRNQEIFQDLVENECEGQSLFYYDWNNKIPTFDEMMKEVYFPSIQTKYGNICVLGAVAKRLAKDNKVMVFSYFPVGQDRCQKISNESYADQVECRMGNSFIEAGNFVLSPRVGSDYYGVSKAEGHPSVQTHTMYAEMLFEEIVNNNRWNFAN